MNKDSLLERYIQEGVDFLNNEKYPEAFDSFSRALNIAPLREDIRILLHKALEGKTAQEGTRSEMELRIYEPGFRSFISSKMFKFLIYTTVISCVIIGFVWAGYYVYYRYFSSVTVSEPTTVSNPETEKSNQADTLYSQSIDALKISDYNRAIDLLEQALTLNPTNPKFQRKLASTLSQKGYQLYNKDDFLGAIELFKKSVEYEPNNPEYFRNLGWSYLELGTRKKNRGESYESYFKDAESAHQKAIQIDPDFAGAYYGLGYVYVRQNKINDAIINYRKAISTQPDSEWASKSQKVLKSLGVD